MAEPLRVLIVDDQALIRSGLRALLEVEDGIVIVGEAGDGAHAHQLVRELTPDVVLMDIRMPGVDGLTATRRIVEDPSVSQTRVLVLTTFDLDEYVFEALRAGAAGFLLKHTEPEQLAHAIRVVAAGEALLSPEVTRRLIAEFVRPSVPRVPDAAVAARLTEREREVVDLVAQGLSNEEIATRWFVSQATVRTHVSRSMAKLHARDRAQLVVLAYQHGLAELPEDPGR
jgi:DNA-binding NarL/FixJ family response regulator